jgi:hypothetical protein
MQSTFITQCPATTLRMSPAVPCWPQFLPQDKVVEFARMDQFELLVATEKAIGDASLYETHQQLNQKRELVKERQNVSDLAQFVEF